MNSEDVCGFTAAMRKNCNANCYNLSRTPFALHSFCVLPAQASGSLSKTKGSLQRDSTFDATFDGDSLMSGMSRGGVTVPAPTRSKYLLPTFWDVCGLPFIPSDPERRSAFNGHAEALLCCRSTCRSPAEPRASLCVDCGGQC